MGAAEVDQEPYAEAGCFQVVEHLGFLFPGQLIEGFQLDNDIVIADEVGDVLLFELVAFVSNRQSLLADKRNATVTQLNFQRLMIDGLQEPRAQLTMYRNRSTDDRIHFILAHNLDDAQAFPPPPSSLQPPILALFPILRELPNLRPLRPLRVLRVLRGSNAIRPSGCDAPPRNGR